MADQETPVQPPVAPSTPEKKKAEKKVTKYYRNTRYAGESILLGFKDPADATTAEEATFVKYAFRVRGADEIEGYLATDDVRVIKRIADIPHIEEIEARDFEKSIKQGRQVV